MEAVTLFAVGHKSQRYEIVYSFAPLPVNATYLLGIDESFLVLFFKKEPLACLHVKVRKRFFF
jgi:hypothetical protein